MAGELTFNKISKNGDVLMMLRELDKQLGIVGYTEHGVRHAKWVGRTAQKVLKDPAPLVRVSELADSSVNFVVRPWVKREDYWTVYFEITEAVKLAFDKEGVSIPFPQRDVHLHQVA